jgi:hypothetical protein
MKNCMPHRYMAVLGSLNLVMQMETSLGVTCQQWKLPLQKLMDVFKSLFKVNMDCCACTNTQVCSMA